MKRIIKVASIISALLSVSALAICFYFANKFCKIWREINIPDHAQHYGLTHLLPLFFGILISFSLTIVFVSVSLNPEKQTVENKIENKKKTIDRTFVRNLMNPEYKTDRRYTV